MESTPDEAYKAIYSLRDIQPNEKFVFWFERKAIETVTDFQPDLVVLDLSMPVMGGLDGARKISAIHPDLPIIMFTMHSCDERLKAAQKFGIEHTSPSQIVSVCTSWTQ